MKVVITDCDFTSTAEEQRMCKRGNYQLVVLQCKTPEEVIAQASDADALLVQYAPITRYVLDNLRKCKVIVRYGIGVDNVDLPAAAENEIPVCNVPDYGINEVADHTAAFALTLLRQIPFFDHAIRNGKWPIPSVTPIKSCEGLFFAVIGAGKIGQATLTRMRAFGFKCVAYDPNVSKEALNVISAEKWSLDIVFSNADIISMHLPLNDRTFHLINRERLKRMKKSAILINTSRGGLVDTYALAEALSSGEISCAGLDVFENEPLDANHPILTCENAVLTPHVAYYSETSILHLQRYASEEVERALVGNPLRCRVV